MTAKFAFVINSLMPGGAERSLVELLPELRDRGITPIVVCLFDRDIGFDDEVRERGFELRLLSGGSLPAMALELRRILRFEAPDLLHTVLFEADIVGRIAAMGTGIPVMTTLANVTYDRERIDHDPNVGAARVAAVRLLDGFTARHLTAHFHAVSHAVKLSGMRALGIGAEDVTVIHRGRDPDRLGMRTPERTRACREDLGLDPAVNLVLTVGRQEYQKGQIHLIRAFAQIAASTRKVVLAIAGRHGNASDHLESAVTDLGLDDRVLFLGHRDDVPDLLAAADVFVFPSLWEGLGGALIEALALEVPIVASDLAPVREVMTNGEHGILVPPRDEAALAGSISTLLDDSVYRRRLVAGNRERFESEFTIEVATDRLIELLSRMARH